MNKKCVYLITNDFDDKKYIGVAEDFERRKYQHKVGHDAEHSYIDKSILIHGWEHFKMEIIDNYSTDEERKELEKKYIKEYNTLRANGGYNLTEGGDDYFGQVDVKGEKNPRAQLTAEDVKNIRQRRMNGERLSTVYEDYKDKLDGNKRAGFSKLWLHKSWMDVCPEYIGHYPEVSSKYFATIRRNELEEYDMLFLNDYFKWNGPPQRYNIIYQTFKEKIDWESFQSVCRSIVEKLYGPKSTRQKYKKTGKLQEMIDRYREELKEEPVYIS